VGTPEGIEHLGGIDFDEAVVQHVVRALGDDVPPAEDAAPATLTALARLRQECVDAKETLSSDTDVAIPVLLPERQATVRLTRSELEEMIRPPLDASIGAVHRALRSADVAPDDLDVVLLVGGSSRIPLVGQLIGAELGRPTAVDAHPKYSVALGAATLAAGRAVRRTESPGPTAAAIPAQAPASAPLTPVAAATAVSAPPAQAPSPATSAASAAPPPPDAAALPGDPDPSAETRRRRRRLVVLAAAALVGVAVAALAVVLTNDDDGRDGEASTEETTGSTASLPATTNTAGPPQTAPITPEIDEPPLWPFRSPEDVNDWRNEYNALGTDPCTWTPSRPHWRSPRTTSGSPTSPRSPTATSAPTRRTSPWPTSPTTTWRRPPTSTLCASAATKVLPGRWWAPRTPT
jgi:hypothetical protein